MGKELKKSSRTAKSSKLSQSKSRKSIGFDNQKYLIEQTTYILDRIRQFDNKLYLEFGGKILYDNHASRVLPGYDRQVKLNLLKELKEKAEVILCISAGAIEQGKIRADFGITYEDYIFRMIDEMKSCGLGIASVVITRFSGQPSANIFRTKLDRRKIRVYIHKPIKNYPKDIDLIVSDKGYGQNDYIKTTKPLAIVAGPGPGSGKLATCLSQLYHEFNKGMKSGYAKFETFPVWNLPLNHPINFAYEASTADIGDYNVIDKFHRKAYQIDAINYNRDIEAFPVVKRIMEQIMGKDHAYKSPTDMGVNRLKAGIVNDDIVRDAAEQEIIRRYYKYSCEYYAGLTGQKTLERMKKILEKAGLNLEQRKVGEAARKALSDAKSTSKDNSVKVSAAAIRLHDGRIVTGKSSHLLHAGSSMVLNAIKILANIPDEIDLLSPLIIKSVGQLKKELSGLPNPSLDLDEALITLSISATTNSSAKVAMAQLKNLSFCEVHLTNIPSEGDEKGFRKLQTNTTWDTK